MYNLPLRKWLVLYFEKVFLGYKNFVVKCLFIQDRFRCTITYKYRRHWISVLDACAC
jgi:hypothetical protein